MRSMDSSNGSPPRAASARSSAAPITCGRGGRRWVTSCR
jgi:hypothetical protein